MIERSLRRLIPRGLPSRLRWHHIQYLLGAFALAAVSFSLYVNFRIMAIYAESLEANRAWAQELGGYSQLYGLASAVSAPGDDVFDSHAANAESARMEQALTTFNARVKALEESARTSPGLDDLRPLLAEGREEVKAAMAELVGEARHIFSHFKEGREDLAGRRMATMDRKHVDVIEALNRLEARARALQLEKLNDQKMAAVRLSHLEYVAAALMVVMVAGATLYGLALVRAAEEAAREKERGQLRLLGMEKMSAIGQLAAGVAHEINNPLGVILGFAQALVRGLKAEDELELPIRSIEREALRCKALVQNLLTFARTSPDERAPIDINAAVEQALTLIAPQAKINRVVVATDLALGLPPILGNKNQLEQVIMNLAKNAIDAMPDGGALTLSTGLFEEAPNSWVCLRFVDDGTGIPPAVASKIFDPFFTTKALGQGTGLGLSLVSEIVQKHSGEISVESRPGRTEFTVKLPGPGAKGLVSHG